MSAHPALVPELLVADLDRSLAFWCGPAGFEVGYRRHEEGFASVTLGDAHVTLDQEGLGRDWVTAPLERPLGRGVNLQIAVDELAPFEARFRAAGCAFFLDPETRRYRVGDSEVEVVQFVIADPDGYLLRYQATRMAAE